MEEIRFTIDKEGNTEVEVNGVKGKSCLDLTKQIEEALGSLSSRTLTKEYNDRSKTVGHQHIRGG